MKKIKMFLKGFLFFPYYLFAIYKFLLKNNIFNSVKSYQKFSSYTNTKKIEKLKNKYINDSCFIIGNAPSVGRLDLDKLNSGKYKIFTVGRGYRLKEKGLQHSDFHVLADPHGYNEFIGEIDSKFSDTFFIKSEIDFSNNVNEFIYYQGTENRNLLDFQTNMLNPLSDSETVIYFTLQIAVFLGFKKIYLIGVDLDFNINGGHVYKSSKKELKRQVKHSVKYAIGMLQSIEFASEYLKSINVEIYNASPFGIVDCMPRVNYEELFNS